MLGGSRLVRPLTIAVIALGVVTAATGAAALVGAVRSDEPGEQSAAVSTEGTTSTSPPSTGPPVTATVSVPPATAAAATTVATSPTTAATAARTCASMRNLTTKGKLAQLLFVAVTDASSARAVLSGPNPAGGVLVLGKGTTWFGKNVLKDIAAAAQVPPLVAADEEGGRVQRIDAFAGQMPSAYAMGRMTPDEVRIIAKVRGAEMAKLGFTMDFAPVVDLYEAGNAVINDRAFSSDPDKVITSARAFAEGLQAAGITPVMKHFPGHGRSTGDSHKQAVQTPSLASLMASDIKPFRALSGSIPAVMVGHLDVPGLTDPGRPTSVSAKAIDGLLRRELGFQKLVITDDLSNMKAITERFSVPQAVLESILAGADLAIINSPDVAAVLRTLEQAFAAGRLSPARVEQAMERIAAVKCP